MAYKDKAGENRFSTKDKMEYHTKCANSGVCEGKKLTETQKVRHALLAERCRSKINRYHNTAKKFGVENY